jgi:anti-sigma factor RsiW
MPCERPKEQLYFYLDGELVPPEATEFASHLQICLTCQQEAARHQRFRGILRTALTEEKVPVHFWASVQHQLARESARVVPPANRRTPWRLWISLGAAAALLLIALGIRLWLPASAPLVVRELVDSQIRARVMGVSYSPIAAHPGVIRQWFQDKVEFAVLVPELPKERYTFLGTRVNYFLDRRVAELAYATDTHMLSLLMFLQNDLDLTAVPTVREGAQTFHVQHYKGYSTVLWQDGAVLCGLVSDLPLQALIPIAREVTRHAFSS